MVKIAVIGNGERAERHVAAIERVNGIEAVAGGPEVIGQADIDAVDVCVETGVAAVVEQAARAGKQVLLEYLPGHAVESICKTNGVSLTLLRPERRQPLARDLKKTIDAGKLGALKYAHSSSIWHWAGGDSASSPDAFLIDQATGALDLITWYFGDLAVKSVFVRDCTLGENGSPSRYVSILLFFADASQAIVEIGRTESFAAGSGLQRMALTGMRGSAYFNDRDHEVQIGANGVRALVDDPAEGLALAFAELAASGLTGNVTVDDRQSCAIVQAAVKSLRTGKPVEVGLS